MPGAIVVNEELPQNHNDFFLSNHTKREKYH